VLVVTEKINAVCTGDVNRWWIDSNGTIVSRTHSPYTASPVSPEPQTLRISVPQPEGLLLGDYTYNVTVHTVCNGGAGSIELRPPIRVHITG
jgi:hypothetical protein